MATQMQNGQTNDFQVQLQALEGEIAGLCQESNPLDKFYREFLDKIIRLLGEGGAILQADNADGFTLKAHINLDKAGVQPDGPQAQLNSYALGKVVESQQGVVLPPNNASNLHDGGLAGQVENNSAHTLMYLPIILESKVVAVFLLISPEGVDARAITGLSGFLGNLCNQAGFFILRSRLLDQSNQITRSDRLREYVSSVHCSLDTRRACYALANFSQELLGVYRCMAGAYNSRGKFRMDSVSGLESVAVKSSFIAGISAVAKEVCKTGKVLLIDNPNAATTDEGLDDGDELITAARLYMLQAGSTLMGIFPIKCEDNVVGALVVEKAVEEPFDQIQRQQIESMLVEAGRAFTNCLSYRDMPLSLAGRALGSLRDKLCRMPQIKRAIWVSLVIMLLVLPFIVPKKLKVMGNAEVIPTASAYIYASEVGIIEDVPLLKKDGRSVKKGESLALMDMQIIESEIARVTGLINEAGTMKQAAIDHGNSTMIDQYEFTLNALDAELAKYKTQKSHYEIKSPIDGKVITRESEIRQLLYKPVSQGQLLLEVVPEDPKWEFIVNVPEDEAGPMLEAYKALEDGESLTAKIKLKSYPKLTLSSKVLGISQRAHVETTGDQKYRNVISVRVAQPEDIDDYQIDLRKGLEGNVAIECGQRSLIYVVTREFVDFLRISFF